MVTVSAPYVAGYLAFREAPFLVEAAQRLQEREPGLRPQVQHVPFSHGEMSLGCWMDLKRNLPSRLRWPAPRQQAGQGRVHPNTALLLCLFRCLQGDGETKPMASQTSPCL